MKKQKVLQKYSRRKYRWGILTRIIFDWSILIVIVGIIGLAIYLALTDPTFTEQL